MKRLAIFTALVLATIAAAVLLWHFRGIVVLFLLSLAVAATLRPVVERQKWLPHGGALLVTYLACLALALVILVAASNPVLGEIQQAADGFVLTYDHMAAQWPTGTPVQQALSAWLPPPTELYATLAGEQGQAAVSGALGVTLGLFDGLANLAVVLVLSLYWSIDQARFERLWLSALPTSHRARAREIWRNIEMGVGAYIRSELLQSLLAALLLGVGYWLMGIKYPALLTVSGALAWLVPWLGAVLAVVPVVLVGVFAAGGSWWLGLGAGLYTLAVLLALEFVVEPRLITRRRHSSLLVVLLALGLGQAWGLAGVLAAPPLAVALQILFSQLLPQLSPADNTQLADQMAGLAERLQAMQADLAAAEAPPAPETLSLVERLSRLVAEAPALNGAPSNAPSTTRQ